MVPLMAMIFGSRLSLGATIPMLIVGDCFAVAFYRAHCRWEHLRSLAPWVVGGLLSGTLLLDYWLGHETKRDYLGPLIGTMVLIMLSLSLLRGKLGDKMVPTSRPGRAVTGLVAGFSTMVSNAAGPVMAIYMTATGMVKEQLMGTSAWYFFIFNFSKIPILMFLTLRHPGLPMITGPTLLFNVEMFPVILVGAFSGKWLLPHIPQKPFNNAVLVLAAVAALTLYLPKK
jgi:uncharacterized membrane protein YfcA